MRSTAFAFLGLTAAAALGLVAIFAQLGFPLVATGPLPEDPSRHNAVAKAVALDEDEESVDGAVPAPSRRDPSPRAVSAGGGPADGSEQGRSPGRTEPGASAAVPVVSPSPTPPPSPAGDGRSPEPVAPPPAPSPVPAAPTASAEPAAVPPPPPAAAPAPAPAPVDTVAPEAKPAKSKPVKSKPAKPAAKPDKPEPKPEKPEEEAPEYTTDASPPPPPAPAEKDKGNGKGKALGHEK